MKISLCLVFISCFLLGAGRVETRDAKVYSGNVRFDADSVIVEPDDGGASIRLGVDELKSVQLHDSAPQQCVGSADGHLVEPWKSADVGDVYRKGSDVYRKGSVDCDKAGKLTILAAGWGAWGNADSFHWAYRTLDGDGQVIVRMNSLDQLHGSTIVGAMIRQDLNPDSVMITTCLDPSGEMHMSLRSASANTPRATIQTSKDGGTWIRLARRGSVFTSYRSADGRLWNRVDRQTLSMQARVLVGVAAWVPGNASRGQAVIDAVSVVSGTAGTVSSLTDSMITEGVVLRDQSACSGVVLGADSTSVTLVRGQQKMLIPMDKIARINFNEPENSHEDLTGQTGVLLTNGDFMQGDLTAISGGNKDVPQSKRMLSVSSAIFGPKEFATDEVAAVIVGDSIPLPAAYRVQTADGSVFQGDSIRLKKDRVSVGDVDVSDVVALEIRRP